MALRDRLIPVTVAVPLFLQNLDTSVMATALPTIAGSLRVDALQLNLAVSAYLLSLSVFLPASGWLAERFGARRTFCWAIACFSIGSALCGAATSLPELVAFRILQGIGGAMMIPVGRLILLRCVPAAQMVAAMVWFTVPPGVGRMIGPLVGGAIVTWTSWRWIFLINIPFGLIGIALALRFIDKQPPTSRPDRFDLAGFALLASGLSLLLAALELGSNGLAGGGTCGLVSFAGLAALAGYWFHSRGRDAPLVDLAVLRADTLRAAVVGGLPLRIALGASPFLLPLLLQLGFGLSALASGLLTVATAVGSLATRPLLAWAVRRLGFRRLLLASTALTALSYASYALFRPDTPHVLVFATLTVGGLVNSLAMVTLATLGYSRVPAARMSHATTLSTMVQQLSVSFGVVLGASLVSASAWWHGRSAATAAWTDFSPAFVVVGALTLLSLLPFARLRQEEGAEMR